MPIEQFSISPEFLDAYYLDNFVTTHKPVNAGEDSLIWMPEGMPFLIKGYPSLDLQPLTRYQRLTASYGEAISGEHIITFRGDERVIQIAVNPILAVVEGRNSGLQSYGLSQIINGTHGDEHPNHEFIEEVTNQINFKLYRQFHLAGAILVPMNLIETHQDNFNITDISPNIHYLIDEMSEISNDTLI